MFANNTHTRSRNEGNEMCNVLFMLAAVLCGKGLGNDGKKVCRSRAALCTLKPLSRWQCGKCAHSVCQMKLSFFLFVRANVVRLAVRWWGASRDDGWQQAEPPRTTQNGWMVCRKEKKKTWRLAGSDLLSACLDGNYKYKKSSIYIYICAG